jgi:hypothetical protein
VEFSKSQFKGIHINNLPMRINSLSEPIIFAADMNVINYSKIFDDLYSVQCSCSLMSKWDPAYKLILNLDETNAIRFIKFIYTVS